MNISTSYNAVKRRTRAVIALLLLSLAATGVFAGVYAIRRIYPLRYVGIIHHYSAKHGLDPVLVASLIHAESRFNQRAVSSMGARGLMQLMEPTAMWAASEAGIEGFTFDMAFDPEINIRLGTWYIARLLNQFGGIERTALAAYNAGSGNVSQWLANPENSSDGRNLQYIPFGETRHYLRRIEQNQPIYRVLLWIYDIVSGSR